ncbi:MAG: Cell division protein FtsL [Pseudomonadota bacterium]|jgi:cell division protein FtsL
MKRSKHRHTWLQGPVNHIVSTLNWSLILLIGFIWLSALAVVYTKHYSRVWHAKSEQLQQQRHALHTEWLQLLVDLSSWTNKSHLEHLAKKQGMIFPEQTEVLFLPPVDQSSE